MTDPVFATKRDAEEFCRERELADGNRWFSRELEDGRWEPVRTNLESAGRATGTATESKPRPPQPGDPREGKPNPNWGAFG